MAEYISREAVNNLIEDMQSNRLLLVCERTNLYILKSKVAEIPAADVQPAKHGTWRKDEQGYDVYVECSECGLNLSTSNYIENEWQEILKYCPYCGARMMKDGEDNGSDT